MSGQCERFVQSSAEETRWLYKKNIIDAHTANSVDLSLLQHTRQITTLSLKRARALEILSYNVHDAILEDCSNTTAGLGYHAALEIARLYPDYEIVVASRKDNGAAEEINKATGQKNVSFAKLDLGDLKAIRVFAATWKSVDRPPIQALVLNAALQFGGNKPTLTKDGLEGTFGINHVGHALLFHLLFPVLAKGARVVIVSSGTHDPAAGTAMPAPEYTTAEQLAHPKSDDGIAGRVRYTTVKLVNILWMRQLVPHLAAEAPGRQITVTAFDPGMMPGTGLARNGTAFERFMWDTVFPRIIPLLRLLIEKNIHTPAESGTALARLAVGEDVKGETGVYYEGLRPRETSVDSHDEAKQKDLWDWTLKFLSNGDVAEEKRLGMFQA